MKPTVHHATGDEVTFSYHSRHPATISAREIEGWLDRMDHPTKSPGKIVVVGGYSLNRDALNFLMAACAEASAKAAWGIS